MPLAISSSDTIMRSATPPPAQPIAIPQPAPTIEQFTFRSAYPSPDFKAGLDLSKDTFEQGPPPKRTKL